DVPSLLVFLPPSADGLVAYLESPANLAVVETLAEQLHRLKPATFECHKIAFNAPRIAHVGLDAVRPQRFRYIMRDSVGARPPARDSSRRMELRVCRPGLRERRSCRRSSVEGAAAGVGARRPRIIPYR